MHQHPYWPGWRADGQCLLGALLSGARHPAGRTDAQRQVSWQRGRFLQHVLQRDWIRKTRAQGCLYWSGTDCRWWVVSKKRKKNYNEKSNVNVQTTLQFNTFCPKSMKVVILLNTISNAFYRNEMFILWVKFYAVDKSVFVYIMA